MPAYLIYNISTRKKAGYCPKQKRQYRNRSKITLSRYLAKFHSVSYRNQYKISMNFINNIYKDIVTAHYELKSHFTLNLQFRYCICAHNFACIIVSVCANKYQHEIIPFHLLLQVMVHTKSRTQILALDEPSLRI